MTEEGVSAPGGERPDARWSYERIGRGPRRWEWPHVARYVERLENDPDATTVRVCTIALTCHGIRVEGRER